MNYIFNNTIDNYLLIPLIGAIMGFILTALMSKRSQPAVSIQVARQYYLEKTVIIKQNTQDSKSSSDGFSEMIVMLGLSVIVVWLYAKHSSELLIYSLLITFSVWVFSLIVSVSTFIKQRVFNYQWWIYILLPFVFLGFSFLLQKQAFSQISYEIAELANKNTPWDFVSNLTWYGRYFYLTQILGVFLSILLMFMCFSGNIYYIALTNFNSSGRKIWMLLLKICKFGKGKNIWILYIIITILSYYLIDGSIAELMEKHFVKK